MQLHGIMGPTSNQMTVLGVEIDSFSESMYASASLLMNSHELNTDIDQWHCGTYSQPKGNAYKVPACEFPRGTCIESNVVVGSIISIREPGIRTLVPQHKIKKTVVS